MKISELLSETKDIRWFRFNKDIELLIDTDANTIFQCGYSSIEEKKLKHLDRTTFEKDNGTKETYNDYYEIDLDRDKLQNNYHVIEARILSVFVVKNWRGISENDGEELKYDAKVAMNLFIRNRRIVNFILKKTKERTVLEDEKFEAAEKIIRLMNSDNGKYYRS